MIENSVDSDNLHLHDLPAFLLVYLFMIPRWQPQVFHQCLNLFNTQRKGERGVPATVCACDQEIEFLGLTLNTIRFFFSLSRAVSHDHCRPHGQMESAKNIGNRFTGETPRAGFAHQSRMP